MVKTALQAGVAECFANHGATELPIVAALDRVRVSVSCPGLLDSETLGHVLASFTPEITDIVKERATTLAWPGGAAGSDQVA